MERITLNSGWEYCKSPLRVLTDPDVVRSGTAPNDSSAWSKCTQFPSEVHVELLANGLIKDPFLKLNEQECQWVGESDWVYRTKFTVSSSSSNDLVFDGLDTFAFVYLNGQRILESTNMFHSHRVCVTDLVRGEDNLLEIVFQSPFLKGRQLEEEALGSQKHLVVWNGDPSRAFVRKAGYHYGWDWGPMLMLVGPWKPIFLESYSTRITAFWPRATVSESLECSLSVAVSTSSPAQHSIRCTLSDSMGKVLRRSDSGSELSWEFSPGEVDLWWAVGMGTQPLYRVQVELVDQDGLVMDQKSKLIGFRRIEVVQRPFAGEPGSSFVFKVNGVPIFAGGSNWIPLDSFLTDATQSRYREWLLLLVRGNQTMIRVWGGGIYESDEFYDLCDELGILVWQDFAFACGAYPAHPEFIKSVKLEAESNVLRLRNHPSLAIFAGNNEDYQVAETLDPRDYDPEDEDGDWSKTNFPAREIYERTLPEIVHRLSDTLYHPGSPWGGKDSRDRTVGDTHEWDVWHGSQLPYQSWDVLCSRFVSEFGMQGLPDVKTIDSWLGDDKSERFPQSETMLSHNKATGSERRIALYLVENIRYSLNLESYIYATQLIQSEALSTAYRLWRRNFKGPGKEYTGGALVWQLNDVWPCVSWSIVDYYLRPKPAYYTIKRSLYPIVVGMKRRTQRTFPQKHSIAVFVDTDSVEIWGANSTLKSRNVTVLVEGFGLLTGERIFEKRWETTLEANRSTELESLVVPPSDGSIVVCTRLFDSETQEVLSRFSTYPEPYKFLKFPSELETALNVDVDVRNEEIKIRAQRPVKGLILSFSTDVKSLSDNCIDLIPGETISVRVEGLTSDVAFTWRYLGTSFVLE